MSLSSADATVRWWLRQVAAAGLIGLRRYFSTPGLLIGTALFAISLTPSLLPRTALFQGVLSGCSFAAGYGIGSSLQWLAVFLGLRMPPGRVSRAVTIAAAVASLALVLVALGYTSTWQNSVRAVMGMPPVESTDTLRIAAVAFPVALLLILIGKGIVTLVRLVWHWLLPYVPSRTALVGSLIIVAIVGGTLIDGVLLRSLLRVADRFYEQLDEVVPQTDPAPARPDQTGSSASLIDWSTIGRDARIYVQSGPDAAAITAMTGKPAITPLRVYVGLRSAETVEARAALALAELQRVGAFDRSVLVLVMPVGTGWVDRAAMDTLEYLHGGDVATVAVQYSYLTSVLSLAVEPDYGTTTAQALFSAVYDYWTNLPRDQRPRLYVHGLSLGAFASQASLQIFDILGDPIQGALWAGPPFSSRIWQYATDNRVAGTPEWLPRFGNDTSIRFTNQSDALGLDDAPWGPMRLVFLQYASDPVVFFEPEAFYREPDWMRQPRGPDVSPALNWYPVVTFLQLAVDAALAQTSPIGYGHVYAPAHYIDAWLAVTDPPGWTPDQVAALKAAIDADMYLP